MNYETLPRMIDISCVKANNTQEELDAMVAMAKKYGVICCFAMPAYTEWLVDQLKDFPEIGVGGAIGFPSGANLTSTKVQEAEAFVKMGCDELDMVINIAGLINGHYDMVLDDMKAVREAAGDKPMKVILEVSYLTDAQIQKGAELAVKAGTNFVKTGTGWGPKPTTVKHIELIHDAIGDAAFIKAAGGVRTLKDIEEMTAAGCSRFGIGTRTVESVFAEAGLLK